MFISLALYAQETPDPAESVFEEIDSQNRYIENLTALKNVSNQAHNLPVGIRKLIGNIPLTLAVNNVKLGESYGEISLMAKIQIPQDSKTLVFGANNIRISSKGDLIGEIKLVLLKDIPLSAKGLGNLVFKGNINEKTGASTSKTCVTLDCNGNFKELFIDGEFILDSSTYRLATPPANTSDLSVKAPFRLAIQDLNDLLVELSFPEFERIDLPGYKFSINRAVLDMSDTRNSSEFLFPKDYKDKGYFTLPENNLWRGLYVKDFTMTLPELFNKREDNHASVLSATNLIIDNNGFTADIHAENLLDLRSGSADGWMFSVTGFNLTFLANRMTGLGFTGNIGVQLSENSQLVSYEAYMSDGLYYVKGFLGKKIETSLFGLAEAQLEPSSYLQLAAIDRQFVPTVVLDGRMQLKNDLLQMESIEFEQLSFSTRSPYLRVKSMGYKGDVSLGLFPVTINNIQLSLDDEQAKLGMNMKLNLMEEKISASTKVSILSERKNSFWKLKNVSVENIKLENVEMAGFSLSGAITMKKDNIYGNCFGGEIKAKIGALSDSLTINVNSIFGKKSFRYWYVEGSTVLPNGLPVAGAVFINGFAGGIYYKVSGTGQSGLDAYVPDSLSALGIKAGVSLYVAQKNVINAKALFEINFLQTGGIQNIAFYAQASFLGGESSTSVSDLFDSMRKNMTNMGKSMAQNTKSSDSGSDVARDIIRSLGGKLSIPDNISGVKAYAKINLDFQHRILDANFKVLLNVAGGLIKGSNPGYEVGSAQLYTSPDKWYVKVGTPRNPVKLNIGIGSLAVTTSSYLMFGYIDETPLPPNAKVLSAFGNVNSSIFSQNFNKLQSGKGVAFGARMEFDTGVLRFLFLEGQFQAGAGFDILFRNMDNCICEGTGAMGINNWFAQGQLYAYLSGRLGARVKIFGFNKNITILSAGAAVLLEVQSPNPTWLGGSFAVNLNILGIIKGKLDMKINIGNKCKIVVVKESELSIDIPIISDVYPANNAVDIDVFSNPQVTLTLSNYEAIETEDNSGNTQKFRAFLIHSNFYIMDKNGKHLEGNIKWNKTNDVATLELKEVLPPLQNFKLHVEVDFEKYQNKQWVTYFESGKPHKEIMDISFKSGEAPDHIPYSNVSMMYPLVGQKNMYSKEFTEGYVQLKKGQPYLFIDNFVYNAKFQATGNPLSVDLHYDKKLMRVYYTFPDLLNKTNYKLNFTASSSNASDKNQIKANTETQTQSYHVEDNEENVELSFEQKLAAKIVSDGSLNLFESNFRTSQYNTFVEKMQLSGFTLPNMRYVNEDTRTLFVKSAQTSELFDEIELLGSEYSNMQPLITFETDNTNNYYELDMYPLMYKWYPEGCLKITSQDNLIYGVPPFKALTFYPNYLTVGMSGSSDSQIEKTFPYMYDLPMYYHKHYTELKGKAINVYINNAYDRNKDKAFLDALISNSFPFMRQGNYRVKFKYTLPDKKSGSIYNLDYINTLDWRQ